MPSAASFDAAPSVSARTPPRRPSPQTTGPRACGSERAALSRPCVSPRLRSPFGAACPAMFGGRQFNIMLGIMRSAKARCPARARSGCRISGSATGQPPMHSRLLLMVTSPAPSSAASQGRCEAPRRVVRGRRGLAGEAARPSRRRASVGERGAPKGRARPQGGHGPGERSEMTRDSRAGSNRVRERDLDVLSRITRGRRTLG